MAVELTDEDKRLIMQLMVQNVFGKKNDAPSEISSTTSCNQLPKTNNNDSENNRLYEIAETMDPNFHDRADFELTKSTREMIIKELMGDFLKNKQRMTTEDKENSVHDSDEVSSLASEDETILRAVIESTINDSSETSPIEPSTSKNDEDVRYEPQCNKPTKDMTESLPKEKPTNAECNASICDLPTRRNSRVTSLEKEEITVNDNDGLPQPSIFDPQDEVICLDDLPCSSSKEVCTTKTTEHTNEGNEQCTEPYKIITEAIQSVKKTLTDSNNDDKEKNAAGSSADQGPDIDNLIVLLKKAKDLISDTASQHKTEQKCTSTDTREESTSCLEKRLKQKKEKKEKKEHSKKSGSKYLYKKVSDPRGVEETNVLRNPDCPGDFQVTSTISPPEEESDIEKEILLLKRDIFKLKKSVKPSNLERKKVHRDVRVGCDQIGKRDLQEVNDKNHETRHSPVDSTREANENVPSCRKTKEKINHGKRSPAEECSMDDRQVTKRQCEDDCMSDDVPPMDDRNSPFFIDKDLVPVSIYIEGLREKRWNPTQVLYEIASQCEWTRPEFTQLNLTLDEGFFFMVKVENCTFTPIRRGSTKKEAKHYASACFLNFLGFDFVYNDLKANSWKCSTSVTTYKSRIDMTRQQLVGQGRATPMLHTVHSSRMLEYCKGGSPNMSRSIEQCSKHGERGSSQIHISDQEYNRDAGRKNYVNIERHEFVKQGIERTSKIHGPIVPKRERSSSSNRSSQSGRCHKRRSESIKSRERIMYESRRCSRDRHRDIKSERRSRSRSPVPHMRRRSSSKRRRHESRHESYRQEHKCCCCKKPSGSRVRSTSRQSYYRGSPAH